MYNAGGLGSGCPAKRKHSLCEICFLTPLMFCPVKREPHQRVSELVGVGGLEIYVVVPVGHVCGLAGYLCHFVVPLQCGLLPLRAPVCFHFSWRQFPKRGDGALSVRVTPNFATSKNARRGFHAEW